MIQINLLTKQKQIHRLREQIFGCRGKEEDGIKDTQGVWDGPVYTAVFKMDNQRGPTVQHMEL